MLAPDQKHLLWIKTPGRKQETHILEPWTEPESCRFRNIIKRACGNILFAHKSPNVQSSGTRADDVLRDSGTDLSCIASATEEVANPRCLRFVRPRFGDRDHKTCMSSSSSNSLSTTLCTRNVAVTSLHSPLRGISNVTKPTTPRAYCAESWGNHSTS